MFGYITYIWDLFLSGLFICGAFSVLTFIVPLLVQWFVFKKEQNFKTKYNATWAIVTGGSSGIGRAVVEKLASQGLNVVIVALDDNLLKEFHKTITAKYPKLQFRAVGVDLSKDGYMEPIINATKDIKANILFNNAGYVTIGLFADLTLERQLKNLEVNCVCSVKITHYFLNKYLDDGFKSGAIIFTSSPAGQMASPFALMYGSTKAFLTEFAVSLSAEVKGDGIEVLTIHPSPVDTNFYNADTAHKSPILKLASKFVYSPTQIASVIFTSIGNGCVVYEQGYWSIGSKMLFKLLDANFFSWITTVSAPFTAEYKKLSAERAETRKKVN